MTEQFVFVNGLTDCQGLYDSGMDFFLEFNGNKIHTDAGKISAEQAKLHAGTEFEKYRIVQDKIFMLDYDKFLLELERNLI